MTWATGSHTTGIRHPLIKTEALFGLRIIIIIIIIIITAIKSRDCVVSIATRLRARRSWVRIPAEIKDVSFPKSKDRPRGVRSHVFDGSRGSRREADNAPPI